MNFKYQKITKPISKSSKLKIGDLVRFGTGNASLDYDYHQNLIGSVGIVVDVWFIEICGYERQSKPEIHCEYFVHWANGKINKVEEYRLIKL